jgi:hypothetical protein
MSLFSFKTNIDKNKILPYLISVGSLAFIGFILIGVFYEDFGLMGPE